MNVNPVAHAAQPNEKKSKKTKDLPAVSSTATTVSPEVVSLAKHHMEMHWAYSVGACCANRISTMIDVAIVIAEAPGDHIRLLAKFLKEAQVMSEDLAGMLESDRDTHLEYSARQEAK